MFSSLSRILIADSDKIVLALLSHILQRQGYSVEVALTTEQARVRLAQASYSAIIADSKLISAVDGQLPRTILLSPEPDSDLAVHSVIQKPVEFGLLIETVRKITG